MKLKNKLKLAFVIMTVLPVLLTGVAIFVLFQIQASKFEETYGTTGFSLNHLYSSNFALSEITDGIYNGIKATAKDNPNLLVNPDYQEGISIQLKDRLSTMVIVYTGQVIYTSSEYSGAELTEILPDPERTSDYGSPGIYRDGSFSEIIKMIHFTTTDGRTGCVYILTSLKQVIPQMKNFMVEAVILVLAILLITSATLDYWIYMSVVKPLERLRIAAQNIRDGNLDFDMNTRGKDEFSDLSRDFEEMRKQLKTSTDQRLKDDAEEKELIRNISHDLKTPLTAIRGYIEGLRDGVANTPEKQQKYIQTIYNKSDDMNNLINELTLFSKLDTNRIPYEFHRLSVKDYFEDCIAEIGLDLDSQDIRLEYNYHPDEEVFVTADPEQLKRVINNIISNSVKYRDPNRKGVILVDIYDEGEYVHIRIRDNGKGIATADLSKIFDRFYRTERSRNSQTGGSGIGLAIVRKIILDHKGKIWAESVEGEGTTMHINLKKLS